MSKMAAEQELKRVEGVLLVQEASSRLEFIFWIFNLAQDTILTTCVFVWGFKDQISAGNGIRRCNVSSKLAIDIMLGHYDVDFCVDFCMRRQK